MKSVFKSRTCYDVSIILFIGTLHIINVVFITTGRPLTVGSLQGVLISLSTVCSNWSEPYTIMGVDITGYNINITRDNSIVNQSYVTNTEYYYNVSQFGVYNISVAAVIGDELEGETNTVMVNVPEGMIVSIYT